LRSEHPPLAKLFIVAGDYIFNGFTVPEKTTVTCPQSLYQILC
jgi:hypothetical protein